MMQQLGSYVQYSICFFKIITFYSVISHGDTRENVFITGCMLSINCINCELIFSVALYQPMQQKSEHAHLAEHVKSVRSTWPTVHESCGI